MIEPVTIKNRAQWLQLAHEGDAIAAELIDDLTVFYQGFDEYVDAKIRQKEAFMVVDRNSLHIQGIVAFSRRNNSITYLGVSSKVDFFRIGSELALFALSQLETSKDVAVNVLQGDFESLRSERRLYESVGFIDSGITVVEAGIPATRMIRRSYA